MCLIEIITNDQHLLTHVVCDIPSSTYLLVGSGDTKLSQTNKLAVMPFLISKTSHYNITHKVSIPMFSWSIFTIKPLFGARKCLV